MATTFYFNTINFILTSYIENLLSCKWLYYKKLTRQQKKVKKYIYKKQHWNDKVSDQEGSGPPWAVMPFEEEEHNIVTRQWKMSARST